MKYTSSYWKLHWVTWEFLSNKQERMNRGKSSSLKNKKRGQSVIEFSPLEISYVFIYLFLIIFTEIILVRKCTKFQVHNSIKHHQHTAWCIHCPQKNIFLACICVLWSPLPSSHSPFPLAITTLLPVSMWLYIYITYTHAHVYILAHMYIYIYTHVHVCTYI